MGILLTYNPKNPDYDWRLEERVDWSKRVLAKERILDWWSIGNSTEKRVPKGSRLYFLRQGSEPKGIFASGTSLTVPYVRTDKGKARTVVDYTFDVLLDETSHDFLDWRTLPKGELSDVNWNTKGGGIFVPDSLEDLWRKHCVDVLNVLPVILEPDDEGYPEGKIGWYLHRRRERSGQAVIDAKAEAKKLGRFHCWVCKFDFAKVYGDLGEDFIECHHTLPVFSLPENAQTKISDLAMVCSNCHRMLHRIRPMMSIQELSELVKKLRDS